MFICCKETTWMETKKIVCLYSYLHYENKKKKQKTQSSTKKVTTARDCDKNI